MISVSWVMNGYNLVLTVLFLTMGRLADRYGHKLALRPRPRAVHRWRRSSARAPAAWTRSSPGAWCRRWAPRPWCPRRWPCCCRRIPEGRQGFAAGLFGALSSAAAAAGPVLGGVLVQRWGWPAVFWFNVPVGALGVVLALTLVRRRGGAALASRSTGPASASSPPGSSASRWRSSRATTGAGPRRSSSASSPPPRCILGVWVVVGAAHPLPALRPAALPQADLRRRELGDHDRGHRADGHLVHARDLHDRDDELHRAEGGARDRRPAGRGARADAGRRLARRPRRAADPGGDRGARRGRRPGRARLPCSGRTR